MKFSPKTEEEIALANLLPAGIYGFEIADAEDTVSKAGNEMIKLTVQVFRDDGSHIVLTDYLMEQMAYKLRHAAEVCGLINNYDKGAIDALQFTGKTGRCKVVIQKDKNGQFPDKNAISDYVRETASSGKIPLSASYRVKPMPSGKDQIVDDEIPF